jgi:hypothetical protein
MTNQDKIKADKIEGLIGLLLKSVSPVLKELNITNYGEYNSSDVKKDDLLVLPYSVPRPVSVDEVKIFSEIDLAEVTLVDKKEGIGEYQLWNHSGTLGSRPNQGSFYLDHFSGVHLSVLSEGSLEMRLGKVFRRNVYQILHNLLYDGVRKKR